MAQFLSEGGIKNSRTGEKPWLFCNDDFAEFQGWGTVAKDINGEKMLKSVNKNGESEWYTLKELYGSLDNGNRQPFWVDQLKGYEFDDDQRSWLYDRKTRYAATLPASQGVQHSDHTGDFDPHVFLCPTTLNLYSLGDNPSHSKPMLAWVLQSSQYPNAQRQYGLDWFAT